MIVLNEKEYAERCLSTGESDKKPFNTLQILSKYYYHHLGYRKKKIAKLLIDYMQNNYPRYSSNINSWNDTIEKIAAKAGKYPLYEISEIEITENELQVIDEIKGSTYLKQLAFTLLCLAKLGNAKNEKNNSWVNCETKDIFAMAHVSVAAKRQDEMLGDLEILGLIEFPKKNDNLSNRVTFVDNQSINVLKIDDFRELGYAYLKYKGVNIIKCRNCNVLIRGNKTSTKKYCAECASYTPQGTKTLICIDCGNQFEVDARLMNKCRCNDCQKTKVRNDTRIRIQKMRSKAKM